MIINSKDKGVNAIKNLTKIESIIKMWNNIICFDKYQKILSIQIIDIPIDLTCHQHTHPWSPELNEAVTSVSIWKHILTQVRTKASHRKQIEYLIQSMVNPSDISW